MITGITADANNLSTYLLKNLIEYKTYLLISTGFCITVKLDFR